MARLLTTLCLTAALSVFGAVASVPSPQFYYDKNAGFTSIKLNVPPRYMWGWGDGLRGYCGSFSYQSFGLRYGNYISAEPMRYAADGKELLLGVNDHHAAQTMNFNYELWKYGKEKTPQHGPYVEWIRTNILQGFGVVGGFFEKKENGDSDYDHIMPILGVAVRANESEARLGRGKILGIYYNDLFRKNTLFGNLSDGFVQKRSKCVSENPVSAAPYEFCLPYEYNYGIALQGNVDQGGETYPIQLETGSWTEPDYGLEDGLHEQVVNFSPTLTIYGLSSGYTYALLRFDHPELVPKTNFIQGAYSHKWQFKATGGSRRFEKFDDLRSDATVFYRVVLIS